MVKNRLYGLLVYVYGNTGNMWIDEGNFFNSESSLYATFIY